MIVDFWSTSSHNSTIIASLGFRNRGRRANAVDRWRVRAGLRSQQPELGPSRLVLCGGSVGGAVPEAELMARYARRRGYQGDARLETDSHSTWTNISNAIPLIEDAQRIKVVSHSLHAEKGRAYLERLRPDLATRLVPARDYRLGEWVLLKPVLTVLGLHNLRRLRYSTPSSSG
jgi:hypothetical protein